MKLAFVSMVSARVNKINESATVSMSNRAAELKAEGKKIYNFGIGEPDFKTPQSIIDYSYKMAGEGKTHYTPSAGIPELREKIAEKMKKKNNIDVSSKNVLVTPTKSYAMTGWRIGYMVAPEDIIKAANKVQQQTLTCAPSVIA
ncbi:aminotransferase class I/II-fold pyridoxal phosphate-dependent enzyme [Acidiplasma sp.]|uniref:aminotransferase class I/II-fold pyridoxal phosphate-dependent enzyme n=1 Tax=Acidiplasma sp. TaxID=1872114 RepID=UPI00258D9F2A|nr:aminotransferase class I/II-fold pyridoxal phosphate-dependent enzyme [Acidiplasma sp.]